jgi:di/tricarboxylate transporter
MAAQKKTVGVSPKTTAAAAAALVAPLVARLLGDLVGIEIDSETAEGLILAGVAAVSAFAAAYAAPPGRVATAPKPVREGGYALVELLVAVILIVLLIWLVAAVVH